MAPAHPEAEDDPKDVVGASVLAILAEMGSPPTAPLGEMSDRRLTQPALIAGRVLRSRTRHIVAERLREWEATRTRRRVETTEADRLVAREGIQVEIATEILAIREGRPEEVTPGVRIAYGIAMDSVRRAVEYDALVSADRPAIAGRDDHGERR